MAQKRIAILLGVQSGLSPIVDWFEKHSSELDSGDESFGELPVGDGNVRSILLSLRVISKLSRYLAEHGVQCYWGSMSNFPVLEYKILARSLKNESMADNHLSLDDLQQNSFDRVCYFPLDIFQAKQIEQLARLSMIHPKTKHIALSSQPPWMHSQLLALKESWDWFDPLSTEKLQLFVQELLKQCGVKELTRPFEAGEKNLSLAKNTGPKIIYQSQLLGEVIDLSSQIADTNTTVLITGESGTGKDLLAQKIHHCSNRRDEAFVAVNCGAIPAELLESELFGHKKGSFTGATQDRIGKFEAAHGGTLFLDEIGELPIALQVKILRAIQNKEIESVGSNECKSVDLRIVAATNKNLEKAVEDGSFREDLYYRLNVIPIHVPPLRDRLEDIELLAKHFISRFNLEKARRVGGVSKGAIRALMAYDWPGNVRELENLMERVVVLKAVGMIDAMDFPEKFRRKNLSEIEYFDVMNKMKVGDKNDTLAGALEKRNLQKTLGETKMKEGFFNKANIQQSAPSQAERPNIGGIQQAPQTQAKQNIIPQGIPSTDMKEGQQYRFQGQISVVEALELLAERMAFPTEGLDFNQVVDRFENILILRALERTNWNRNRAAGLLKLNRTTLVEKLKKKQLTPPAHLQRGYSAPTNNNV